MDNLVLTKEKENIVIFLMFLYGFPPSPRQQYFVMVTASELTFIIYGVITFITSVHLRKASEES